MTVWVQRATDHNLAWGLPPLRANPSHQGRASGVLLSKSSLSTGAHTGRQAQPDPD